MSEPLVRKVDCVRLYVADLEAGLAFYRDRLGHALIWRTEQQAGLRLPDDTTELVLHTEPRPPEIDLLVDSADAAVARFEAAGGKVLIPPFDIQIGRCAVVQDPWGNELVLLDSSKGQLVTDVDGNVIGSSKSAEPVVRRATCADVPGIAAVVREVWGQEILADVARAQIESDACALWVAADEGGVVGFLSAFGSVGEAGQRRWEVDLLAVRPASQGRGLGRRLIEQVCQDAVQWGASLARAAVRVENVASQRAFTHAGFSTDGRVHRLLLWFPQPAADLGYTGRVALLPVDTLTYRGLWIEGLTAPGVTADEQRQAVAAARAIVARDGRLNAGALVPADEEHLLAADLRSEAGFHGEYYWLHRDVRP